MMKSSLSMLTVLCLLSLTSCQGSATTPVDSPGNNYTPGTATQTVFMRSTGKIADFPAREFVSQNQELDDRLTDCTTFGYDDKTCIETRATKNRPDDFFRGDGQTGRCHSEVSSDRVAQVGDSVWAVTAIMFGGKNNSARILHQWKDTQGWDTSSFLVAEPTDGTDYMSLYLAVFVPPATEAEPTGKRVNLPNFDKISTLKVGSQKWYTIATLQKFSTGADGYIDVYFNGQKVPPIPGYGANGHTYSGPTLSHSHPGKFLRYQVGNYAFFRGSAAPEDRSINFIDNTLVASGSHTAQQVLIPINENHAPNTPKK